MVLLVSLGLGGVACGAAQTKQPINLDGQVDEGKAGRLLKRALEADTEPRLRLLIERFAHTKKAAEAREELGKLLVQDAKIALERGDLDFGEDRAAEAKRFGDLETTREAQKLLDSVDDRRAKQVGEHARGMAEEGKCSGAVAHISNTFDAQTRDRYRTQVQAAARSALVTCLAGEMDEQVAAGKIDEARAALQTIPVRKVLDAQGQSDAEQELAKSIVKHSLTSIQPLIQAKQWQAAMTEIGGLRSKKALGAKEHAAAVSLIQDAMLAHILQLSAEALSAKKPSELWAEIEQTEKLAAWKKRPEQLDAPYALLAVAIECEIHQCKWAKPKARWSFGEVALQAADSVATDSQNKLKHADQVWVLAEAKDHVLISTEKPAEESREALLKLAKGWAKASDLKATDTELWLPPEAQLVGVRVWAPLREENKGDYHLGIISALPSGGEVQVKRLADNVVKTVKYADIRVGALTPGLKVMAFCTDQLFTEPAKVDRIVTVVSGVPRVKVICDKERMEKIEGAGALTSKRAWLPARRP